MYTKAKINLSQFDKVQTVYEFAEDYKDAYNIKSKLVDAEIVDADAKDNETGETLVILKFEREAHSLTLNEVCEFMDVNYVLVGILLDTKTRVLLGVGAN